MSVPTVSTCPSFRVVSRGWQTRSVWKTQKLRNVKHLSVLSSALRAAGHATKSPARLLSDVPAVVVNNAPYPANRRRRRNQLNPVLLERLFRAALGTTFGWRIPNLRRMRTYISTSDASRLNGRALPCQLRKLMELRRSGKASCSSRICCRDIL